MIILRSLHLRFTLLGNNTRIDEHLLHAPPVRARSDRDHSHRPESLPSDRPTAPLARLKHRRRLKSCIESGSSVRDTLNVDDDRAGLPEKLIHVQVGPAHVELG